MINTSTPTQDVIGAQTLEVIAAADKFNKWMYDEIRPYLQGEVLEIGCGIGNISTFVLKDGFSTTLSDYNNHYTTLIEKKFAHYSNLKNILCIDLQDASFKQNYQSYSQSFDSIFLLNVIEHLAFDNEAIINCKFLLKPGGNLILLAPSYQWLYCKFDKNLGHYRRYTKSSLAFLFASNNMNTLIKKHFNMAGIMGWLLYGKLLQQQQLKAGNMRLFNQLVPLFKLIDICSFRLAGLSVIVVGKK